MSNKGYLGWDPNYRQITCWCVDIDGNRPVFLWQNQADGTWDTWAPGGSYKGTLTVFEDGTWRHESEGEQLHFKPLAK